MIRETIFSPNRVYRYTLWREWPAPTPELYHTEDPHLEYYPGRHDQYVMFIGLNPSTADETKDDPTIRKCVGFAKRWGYGALCMTNLFAFRATDPKVMMEQRYNALGPDSNRWLLECSRDAGRLVAAWGANGKFLNRDKDVVQMLDFLECLRKTKAGHPEHPLYVPYTAQPIPFP